MNSPLPLSLKTLNFFLIIITWSISPFLTQAYAASVGKAKVLRCGQKNTDRCEITANVSLVDGQKIELYRGSRLIYSGSIILKQSQKYVKKYPKFVVEGEWYVKYSQRLAIMKTGAVLLIVPSRRHYGEDSRLASLDSELDADSFPGHGGANHEQGGKIQPDPDSEPSVIEKIEKWASRSDGQDSPRLNIGFRAGTPNSPSSMIGVSIDLFFISRVIPVTLSGGEYDSRRFVRAKDYGSLKYSTQSIGTGLLIGKSWTRFKIGANYTVINAKSRATDNPMTYEAMATTYSGLTPHVGFYGISSGEGSYAFEYGSFVPFTTRYRTDPGAPYRPNGAPRDYRNRSQYFSLGFGLAF